MADRVLIEEEEIPRRVFNDRNNPLETMNATQLLREYRFDRQSILRLTATLEHDIEHQTRRSYTIPALLQVPLQNEDQFVNRKNFHSINVQLICDPDCKITNVTAEWPGSTHDARLLSESNIYRSFENVSHRGLLLGDSGCRSWLMTPFRNPVGDAQAKFIYFS